ncbi:hypothetical protein Tco_0462395 [Tanacetum coccineum]
MVDDEPLGRKLLKTSRKGKEKMDEFPDSTPIKERKYYDDRIDDVVPLLIYINAFIVDERRVEISLNVHVVDEVSQVTKQGSLLAGSSNTEDKYLGSMSSGSSNTDDRDLEKSN